MCNMSLLFCSVCIILFAVCSSHAEDSVELSGQSHDALVEKYNKIIQNLKEKNQKLEQITEGLRTLCSSFNDLPKEQEIVTHVDSSPTEHSITLQAKTTRAETTADSILFVVEYESPSEPLVLWSQETTMYHYEDIMSTKTDVITNEFDGKHGKTTLLTSKTQKFGIMVSFQTELDYISLDLILPENNRTVSMEQQVPPVEMEVITDGKEVSYTVGDILTFNVTVSLAGEADESDYRIQDPQWYFITTNQSSTPQSVVVITQYKDESKKILFQWKN
ncbi:uncharacterized protein LOC121375017 [Gigantopelta aegis]|uniref:uncharacterized protein LOC121375017 n=1 Tax=Gigantopelta aegis TaxID=1735272 RepID=UPI001B88E473|nr:uncharacterized protein LOC121375017 [Gigantopelta aegis]